MAAAAGSATENGKWQATWRLSASAANGGSAAAHAAFAPGQRVRKRQPVGSALRDGRLDCVIGRVLDGDDTSGFAIEALYHQPIVIVARPGHRSRQ